MTMTLAPKASRAASTPRPAARPTSVPPTPARSPAPASAPASAPTTEAAIAGLSERAMTVSLSLSAWQGKRLDRKVTTEVLEERKAEKDAGRFEKYLIPPKELEPISKAHTRARQRHYTLSLPWGDEGVRIIPSEIFFDYSTAMAQERSACEATYRDFAARYPALLSLAPARLGPALFNGRDFPDPQSITARFGFRLVILPVPDQQDFRVSLGRSAEQEIRQSIEETVKARYAEAQRDLWTRLLDTVRHFATTMQTKDKVFRDTTVTKLADLARLAPKLSLTKDPRLEELCAEVLSLTEGVRPEDLRENARLRRATAQKAHMTVSQIEDALAGAF